MPTAHTFENHVMTANASVHIATEVILAREVGVTTASA
jgi:hypothetical protein